MDPATPASLVGAARPALRWAKRLLAVLLALALLAGLLVAAAFVNLLTVMQQAQAAAQPCGPAGDGTAPPPTGYSQTFYDDFTGPLDGNRWRATGTTVHGGYAALSGRAALTNAPDGGLATGRYEVRLRAARAPGVTITARLTPTAHPTALPQVTLAALTTGKSGYTAALTSPAGTTTYRQPADTTAWHTYAVEWSAGVVRYLLDGQTWQTTTTSAAPTAPMALTVTASGPKQARTYLDWVAGYAPTATTGAATGGQAQTQDVGTLDAEQQANIATIIGAGRALNVPDRGLVIALATARQESVWRNLAGGDSDSIGLFQQRPSQDWGTPAQLHDPVYASQAFYRRLVLVPGWQTMVLWQAATAVQHPAAANEVLYQQWEPVAQQLVAAAGGSIGGTGYPTGGCGGTPSTTCPATGLPTDDAHLTPDARALLRCVVQQFHLTDVACWAGEGHIPGSDHYTGKACDFMVPASGGYATAAGRTLGNQIAAYVLAHAKTFGVHYIIWHARISDPAIQGGKWRDYHHPQGRTDPTALHMNHVHVSVFGDQGTAQQGGDGMTGQVVLPIPRGTYRLTAGFNQAGGLWSSGHHTGQDFAAPVGTVIHAVAAGRVVATGMCTHGCAYGNLTEIDHGNGVHTWYAHQSRIDVRPGQQVAAGTPIGAVGATGNVTGPHLHLEVRINGTPVDPLPWLRSKGLQP